MGAGLPGGQPLPPTGGHGLGQEWLWPGLGGDGAKRVPRVRIELTTFRL